MPPVFSQPLSRKHHLLPMLVMVDVSAFDLLAWLRTHLHDVAAWQGEDGAGLDVCLCLHEIDYNSKFSEISISKH